MWLLLLYFALVLAPLALAFLFGKRGKESFVYELGLNVAVVGFAVLAMQFILSARWKWTERPFGLDTVYGFHRAMGMFVGLLLLAHPLLLAAGRRGWPLLLGLHQRWYIWVGRGALLLLVVLAVQAVFRSRLRLDYQRWQASHGLLAILLLGGGFVHVWFAGGDSRLPAMKATWLLLGGAALTAYLWQQFVAPARLRRRAYVVTEVVQEAAEVWTVAFAPPPGEAIPDYLPGQYQYLTLCRNGLPTEEHPFTLSSSPTRTGSLSSTIKASGDFTKTIGLTRPGDTVLVDVPFGRFSYVLHPDETALVFLAGGIGITPLISMLRALHDTGTAKDVLLLYANRTEADIVFRKELEAMQREGMPRLQMRHFLSKPADDWAGETGHITKDTLRRLVPDTAGKGFYLCGPAPFIDSLASALQALGVPDSRIHLEQFNG